MGDAFLAEAEIRNHGDDVDPEFMVMALIPQLPVDATKPVMNEAREKQRKSREASHEIARRLQILHIRSVHSHIDAATRNGRENLS
jgi:hypothetical protein